MVGDYLLTEEQFPDGGSVFIDKPQSLSYEGERHNISKLGTERIRYLFGVMLFFFPEHLIPKLIELLKSSFVSYFHAV